MIKIHACVHENADVSWRGLIPPVLGGYNLLVSAGYGHNTLYSVDCTEIKCDYEGSIISATENVFKNLINIMVIALHYPRRLLCSIC